MKYLSVLISIMFSIISCQSQINTDSNKKREQYDTMIDDFVKYFSNDPVSIFWGNGLNAHISNPKNDEDALNKGFEVYRKLKNFNDYGQNGKCKILLAKDVLIRVNYRAILYQYKNKRYLALYRKEPKNELFFKIFSGSEAQHISAEMFMLQKGDAQIDAFVSKSNTDMFWGNGAWATFKSLKDDRDALLKGGIKLASKDTEKSNKIPSGALMLIAKDVIIHQKKYRAVLFENDNSTLEIAVYQKTNNNQFLFRTYPVDILPDSVIQNFSYINKNTFDIVKKYIKETGTDAGDNFGVYLSGIENYLISYTDKPREENISISKIGPGSYSYQLKVDQNGNVIWDYLCIPLQWRKSSKEHELNEIIRAIVIRVDENKN